MIFENHDKLIRFYTPFLPLERTVYKAGIAQG